LWQHASYGDSMSDKIWEKYLSWTQQRQLQRLSV